MTYPNLSSEKIIALDLETKDSNILKLGPGAYRAKAGMEDSRILCVSIATWDKQWAFPWNAKTEQWLKDNSHLSIIAANIMYDLMWLYASAEIEFQGNYYDILINESIIDAGRSWYNLDKCAEKYLQTGKGNDEIKDYCEAQEWKGDARQHLWRMWEDTEGQKLVLKYGMSDARQTFDIAMMQNNIIDPTLHELESKGLKPLFEMKKNGVRIDVKRLKKTKNEINLKLWEIQKNINKMVGFEVNVAANVSMKKAFDKLNLAYPLTAKGNPSFTGEVLENIQHPFTQICSEWRGLSKLQNTYLEGFEKFLVGDRVYTEFHPVKNGNRGTATGRYSATRPALQTIPKRGEGKKIARGLFLPDEGCLWNSIDQSQEEYRIFAHYARGGGAEKLRQDFITDVNMDMHQWTSDYTGINDRQLAKTLNFLSLYGGGCHKFAAQAGFEVPPPWPPFGDYDRFKKAEDNVRKNYKAGRLYYGYHDRLPCIKETAKQAQKICEQRGYAKTILGHRRYLSRKDSYKALNTTVQGTGGDVLKLWINKAYDAGVFNVLKLGLLVHDEITFSKPQTKEGEEAAKELQRIGETCIKLRVPLKCDREEGKRWSDLKEVEGCE